MKNQNDIIITAVTIVLALIVVGIMYGTKPNSVSSAQPTPVQLKDTMPEGASVKMANSLPNASSSGFSGGGGGGGFAAMGGPAAGSKAKVLGQGGMVGSMNSPGK